MTQPLPAQRVRIGADLGQTIARMRVGLLYAVRHLRRARLDDPQRFTELVQLRKLHDRSAYQPLLMDKLAAKRFAATLLGSEWVVPTLWQGKRLPDRRPIDGPVMVKARHGCNQYAPSLPGSGARAWHRLCRRAARWVHRPYGYWLDEWAYRDVARGILVEPLLGGRLPLPIDYKIYVFAGRATHVQVHLGRGRGHRWILHDRAWRQLVPSSEAPPPPPSLAAMLDAAKCLARGTDFLRVDFYDIDGHPYFGEFCLYPGSGLDPFAADWIDRELGGLWLEAMHDGSGGNRTARNLLARA